MEQTSLTEPVEQLHSEYVHTIGNLTLTGYNSELSNKPFEWKKAQLASSGVQLSRSIAQQDSWDFEKIQQRSIELAELICRAWPGPVEAHNHELSPLWQRLVHIVENLPGARWTSYGELAKAVGGGGGQSVGNFLSSRPVKNAYRVLRADGSVSSEFRWLEPGDTRDVRVILEGEGVQFRGKKASPEQKIYADELAKLLPPTLQPTNRSS